MILDGESGLRWTRITAIVDDLTGGECIESQCIDHPRLTKLVQRATRDQDYVESYHVAGLANYYSSVAEAIQAMEGNP